MASKQLLSNFGKRGDSSYTINGIPQGLADIQVDVEDDSHLSTYFHVVEFNPVFTAGKNSISFNGSDLLKDGSEIKVEVLDKDGNSLYLAAPPTDQNYVDIANFTVAIYVYRETVSGVGKVILAGITTKGEIVRWIGNISINVTYPNVSRVRFYHKPTMEVTPLLYPVVETLTGSLLASSSLVADICSGQYVYRKGFHLIAANNIFSSQMVGQSFLLKYGKCQLVQGEATQIGTYDLSTGMFGATGSVFIVKSVVNSKTIQIDPPTYYTFVPHGQKSSNVMIMGMTGGQFTMSYNSITHIQQATTVPANGQWMPRNILYHGLEGYMQIKTNTDVFDSTMVGKGMMINYSYIWVDDGGGGFDPSIKTFHNKYPISSSLYPIIITDFVDSRTVNVPLLHYKLYYGLPGSEFTYLYHISKFSGNVEPPSSSIPYQQYTTTNGSSSLMQKSYADILYRNTDTFSGFIARHKLYAKSNIYPGDFELVSDSVVGPSELLIDQISVNKSYALIGKLENQDKVNQYWFVSSASFNLVQSDDKISDAMTIVTIPDYSAANGSSYVIAKASAINLVNDAIYYPFDEMEYTQFNGKGYASNFIFIPRNTLHILSANMVVNKDKTTIAKISFYLTSSSQGIMGEPNYVPAYGLKLGEIVVADQVTARFLLDAQQMFFTTLNDYYGTLIIVPYFCNVTLANISMQNYGDYGFSPGAIEIQCPFPLNVANESFTLKAELFDSNANLVYTIPKAGDPPIIATFDPTGVSLFGSSVLGSAGGTGGIPSTLPSLTVQSSLFLPGIGQCPSLKRLLGFNIPTHYPPLSGEGSVCYTDVTDLELTASTTTIPTLDYLSLSTTAGSGRSLAVRYNGTSPNVYGRRVYVDPSGVKTTYS